MSVENLRGGLSDLTTGLEKRRKAKKDAEDNKVKAQAQFELGQNILDSAEGKTTSGNLLGRGVQTGLIDLEKASGELSKLSPEQQIMMLHSKIATTTDPVEKSNLMQIVDNVSHAYERMNFEKAYGHSKAQALGLLEMKAKFGVLNPGKGGGGGSSSGGGVGKEGQPKGAPGTRDKKGNIIPFTPDANTDLIPMTIDTKGLYPIYEKFITQDRWKDKIDPATGYLKTSKDVSVEDQAEFTKALDLELNNYFANNGELSKGGYEIYQARAAEEVRSVIATQGPKALVTTGTTKDGIDIRKLSISIPVPKEIVFSKSADERKSFIGGKFIENANKGVNAVAEGISSLIPFGKKQQAKKVQKKEEQSEADYYLK